MLAEKQIDIAGKSYTVREQTMRVVLPILEGDPAKRGLGLMKASVFHGLWMEGAVPLGDDVLDLGFRAYSLLQQAVLDVYDMGAEGDLGNVR